MPFVERPFEDEEASGWETTADHVLRRLPKTTFDLSEAEAKQTMLSDR